MVTIVTRAGKGSPLTNTEVDANFTNLNSGKAEVGANTDITSVALTTGTISTAPSANTDIANKLYVDGVASGLNFHSACNYATTAALAANTYNNGSSGVGATLTAVAVGTLTIDGYTLVVGDVGKRILIKNEVTQARNGVYTLTQAGTAVLPYILTRATDYDTSGSGTNEIDAGDFILVLSGSSLSNSSWVQQTPLPITVGTTSITFTQFAAPYVFTYPAAGIANSTGSAWGTSYSTTGTGTVVALATSPSFTTPALGTPSALVGTNITGTATSFNINGTVGATTPAAGTFTSLSDSGNLTFTGTGNRITGDMSNATVTNRVAFQTSTANSNTVIPVIPSGTATQSGFDYYNNSDITNAAYIRVRSTSTEASVLSSITGTGTYLPMTFYTGGSERVRIDTSGGVLIGLTSALTVSGASSWQQQIAGTGATGSIVARFSDNANPARFIAVKSRGTSVGTNTIVQNGDELGSVDFAAADGTSFTSSARISAFVDGAPGAGDLPTRLTFNTAADGSTSPTERMRIDSSGKVGIGTTNPLVTFAVNATDAVLIPVGTTAQQPTGAAGYLRFNSSTTQFEGHNGTTWASVGGAAISNDTTTATNVYPLFASATSGTALTVYTSNAKYLYKPSTGELQSSIVNATNGIHVNSKTVATSYTIATGNSAMSVGKMTIASGQSVTVSSGSRWVIL